MTVKFCNRLAVGAHRLG